MSLVIATPEGMWADRVVSMNEQITGEVCKIVKVYNGLLSLIGSVDHSRFLERHWREVWDGERVIPPEQGENWDRFGQVFLHVSSQVYYIYNTLIPCPTQSGVMGLGRSAALLLLLEGLPPKEVIETCQRHFPLLGDKIDEVLLNDVFPSES